MIEEQLRGFIIEQLRWPGERAELTDDYPLIERGVVDSVGLMSLVGFVESEFAIQVDDLEIVPEHFGTIAGIAALVEQKRVQRDAPEEAL